MIDCHDILTEYYLSIKEQNCVGNFYITNVAHVTGANARCGRLLCPLGNSPELPLTKVAGKHSNLMNFCLITLLNVMRTSTKDVFGH